MFNFFQLIKWLISGVKGLAHHSQLDSLHHWPTIPYYTDLSNAPYSKIPQNVEMPNLLLNVIVIMPLQHQITATLAEITSWLYLRK